MSRGGGANGGVQGILRNSGSGYRGNRGSGGGSNGSGNRVSFETGAATVQSRLQHMMRVTTVPMYSLEDLQEKCSAQNSECCYTYADEPDDLYVNWFSVCEPYSNDKIYAPDNVNCPRTNGGDLATAFYAVLASHRVLHALYSAIADKLKHSSYKNVQIGCFRPMAYKPMPTTFITVPFNLRNITVGGVSCLRYAFSNTIRKSLWGVGFDEHLSTSMMDDISKGTLEIKKKPPSANEGAANANAAANPADAEHKASQDAADEHKDVSASAAPANPAAEQKELKVEDLNKDTVSAACQAVILARMLAMSPSEMMAFLIHKGMEKINKLFNPEHHLFMGPLEEAVFFMNSFDCHVRLYAKVEGLVIPGQPLSGMSEGKKIIRIDQLFSLYNAIGLLYEHLQGYAVIGLMDGTVISSPYQLIAAVFAPDHLPRFVRDDTKLRELAEEYAALIRTVDDHSHDSDWSDLHQAQLRTKALDIVTRITVAHNEFATKMSSAISGLTMLEAAFPSFFKKSTLRALREIDNDLDAHIDYNVTMEDLREKPDWSRVTELVSIHQPLSGLSGLFGHGRMNAFSRPGQSVRDALNISGSFSTARSAFEKRFSETRRKSGFNQALVDPQQHKKLLDLIRDHAFVAAMLPFQDYEGVPVADLPPLRDIISQTVYSDQLTHPVPVHILNPELTLWENTALDVEWFMRNVQSFVLSAPEIAKAFMFTLQGGMHMDNDESCALILYGPPGSAKSETLRQLKKYMYRDLIDVVSSQTLAVMRSSDSYTLFCRLTEEAAVLNLCMWADNVRQVYQLQGQTPPNMPDAHVADVKASFNCSTRRDQRGQNTSTGRHLQDTYRSFVTVNLVTTGNHPGPTFDAAISDRSVIVTYLGGAVKFEPIAMRDDENRENDRTRAFGDRMYGTFSNVNVAYFLARQCGLVKFFNSVPTANLQAKIGSRLQTVINGLSFYYVTEGKVMDASNSSQKFYEETQETARQMNMRRLITFIANKHLSGAAVSLEPASTNWRVTTKSRPRCGNSLVSTMPTPSLRSMDSASRVRWLRDAE
jgi:hypothetical protein